MEDYIIEFCDMDGNEIQGEIPPQPSWIKMMADIYMEARAAQ